MGGHEEAPVSTAADREAAARALMYLLAAIGTAVVASIVIPEAPLHDEEALPVLAGIAYAASIGVLFGFERLPTWCRHALLLSVTTLISWAVYASGEPGSAYTIFLVWVAIYAAFFFRAVGAALQTLAMSGAYGVALLLLDNPKSALLHWTLTTSALLLVTIAIQALSGRVARLVERLTHIGRTDAVTGLYNGAAFKEMLNNEVERSRRSGNRLGLVLGELDDLTAVAAGPLPPAQQQLLAGCGAIFRETPRQIDSAARMAGGRFALLLPYTDEHGAYLVAERIRGRVAALDSGRARMSLGVACFPRSGSTASAAFQAAETGLQEAQEAGGDRVMIHQRSASEARVEIDLSDAPEQERD